MARKVILSRKGFDKTSGGKPSPILDEKFISLPIPRAGSRDLYSDLAISPEASYLKVMQDLGINRHYEGHIDPDIRKSIIKDRPDGWKGLFGQSGTPQGILNKNKVGKGDIFLFFGWFKEAKQVNGIWKFRHNAPNIHAIFGYLEVDEVFNITGDNTIPSWIKYHPHYRDKTDYEAKRNAIYMATDSFTGFPNQPGSGVFNYHTNLVLTKKGVKHRSVWELPDCFKEEKHNFKCGLNNWSIGNHGLIETQPIGQVQEVFISENPDVISWAEKLITTCSLYD